MNKKIEKYLKRIVIIIFLILLTTQLIENKCVLADGEEYPRYIYTSDGKLTYHFKDPEDGQEIILYYNKDSLDDNKYILDKKDSIVENISVNEFNKEIEGATYNETGTTLANTVIIKKGENSITYELYDEDNNLLDTMEDKKETKDDDDKDDDDDIKPSDIGDGILGILFLGAKLGILAIGGIIALLLSLFAGEGAHTLSVQDIIFNKVKITDINFFDFDGTTDVIKTIRENVANWYVGVRNLASVVLVIILIYVGIRMAISTIAEEKAKYKQMLIDWFTSLCLLYVLHYIILLTIQLNNTLVSAIGDASSTGDIGKQFADKSLTSIKFTEGMGNAICYLLLEALTFGFLIAYIKRMITIAFLIIIAPLVTITYSIDRMGDGKSQALNMWFKEFAYNILIQPFHCIAFLALCSTAVDLGKNSDLADATLAICLLAFLAKSAEDIVKRIFGFQAESMPSPAVAAALGYTVAKNTTNFAKKISSKATSKAPKLPQDEDGGSNGGANPTPIPTRASENNMQTANNVQQHSNSNTTIPIYGPNGRVLTNVQRDNPSVGQIVDSNGRRIPSMPRTSVAQATPRASAQTRRVKQRKLSGQGVGGKVIRGFARTVLSANAYALTMGTGLALGASQGDLSSAITGTSMGFEIGEGIASHNPNWVSGNHYKQNTARVFNNYKASTGMSDEDISKRAMGLLKGDIDPQSDDDRRLKKAVIDMTNHYRAVGSSEDDSIKETKQVLNDITSGKQGEESGIERFRGNIQGAYYTHKGKKYSRKLNDTENQLTTGEKIEYTRKLNKARNFLDEREARQDLANRNNE